jgi:hypothetical protein
LDPLTFEYPFLTPYQYASCEPISNIDQDGLEGSGMLAPVYVYARIGGSTFAPAVVQGVTNFIGSPIMMETLRQGLTVIGKNLGAFVLGAVNSFSSDHLFGQGLGDPAMFGEHSPAAALGQKVGHLMALGASVVEFLGSTAAHAPGLVLDAGVITIPAGVGVHGAALAGEIYSGSVFLNAIDGLTSGTDEPTESTTNESPSQGTSETPSDPPRLEPEEGYRDSKKHGINWTQGKAQANNPNPKTGKKVPQGQWGSEEDLKYAGEKAATLEPGKGDYFPLPEGSKSIVHMPDGSTKPATHIWVRNNGTGTFHGYPLIK